MTITTHHHPAAPPAQRRAPLAAAAGMTALAVLGAIAGLFEHASRYDGVPPAEINAAALALCDEVEPAPTPGAGRDACRARVLAQLRRDEARGATALAAARVPGAIEATPMP